MSDRVLLAVLLASAGCVNDEGVALVPDAYAGIDSDGWGCNAVYQTGCGPMEKCTWFGDQLGCAPDGTVAVGGACTMDADGDDCSGAVCHDGVCRAFCTLSPDSCDEPEACVEHADALADHRSVGVCVPP